MTAPLDICEIFPTSDSPAVWSPEKLPENVLGNPLEKPALEMPDLPAEAPSAEEELMSTAEWAQVQFPHLTEPDNQDDLASSAESRALDDQDEPPHKTSGRSYRALFGPYGLELQVSAESGDREACCRLGILLLCRDLDLEQAMRWLVYAARAQDAMAQSLVAADAAVRRELAAAYALDLALPTGSNDLLAPAGTSSRSPAVYYQAAADAGHPGAAYRLGLLTEAQEDFQQARHWYTIAAAADYPAAAQRLSGLDAHR